MIEIRREVEMPWIDLVKGAGILLVIAGHILGWPVKMLAYAFHMPLFFLISGYLFRPQGIHRFKSLLIGLILPSGIAVLSIVTFFWAIPEMVGGGTLSKDSFLEFYGQGNLVVAWFPVVLGLTLLAGESISVLRGVYLQGVVVFLCLALSYENEGFAWVDMPLSIPVTLHSVVFFYLGNVAAQYSLKLSGGFFVVAAASLAATLLWPTLGYDLHRGELGVVGVSLVNALVLSLALAAALRAI